MQISESIDDDGVAQQTFLEVEGEVLRFRKTDGLDAQLDPRYVEVTMKRYAEPLDPDIAFDGPTLELGGGRRLTLFYYILRGKWANDMVGRDYLVYEEPGSEPLAALSVRIANALEFLARR